MFFTDNFPPEVNAPATRTYEHAIQWVKQGCKVTIITCAPNFPEGKIYSGYKNKWYYREKMNGINVVRVKTYMTANEGFFRRTLDYLSFMVVGFFAGLIQKKADIIVATSPQFFTACAGFMLSIFHRRPFVFELRDLWPASIVAVGAMKNSGILKLLEKLELFLYRKADAIISVTSSFKKELISRGIDEKKIFVILNGVDLERYRPTTLKDSELSSKYSLEDKFVLGYVGTHGVAHGLDIILCVAEQLQKYPEIYFLLVGSGAEKKKLIKAAERINLKNIIFVDQQPKEMMQKYWSLCNLSLIHLKNYPLFTTVIPSKLFESMGMGVPVIMALPEGEATSMVREYNCGVTIPPEDVERLKNTILELKSNERLLDEYKKSAIKASLLFSRDIKGSEMLVLLKKIAKK
jgi:glycosyltransferase involved in cell wall biosynthesis